MLRKSIFSILFIFNSVCGFAQIPTSWIRTYPYQNPTAEIKKTVADSLGNTFTMGYTYPAMDIDPGPGTQMTPTNSAFIVKLDNAGDFVWAKTVLNPGYLRFWSVALDNTNNILICGGFSSSNGPAIYDLDPGPGTFTVAEANQSWGNAFVVKLDNSGNFLWANVWTMPNAGIGFGDIACDNNSNVFLCGGTQGNGDMDPGPAVSSTTFTGGNDPLIIKLSPAGNFIWGKQFSFVDMSNVANVITLDNAGSVYMAGGFQNVNADFDPGPGTYPLSPVYDRDGFIVKLNSNGNFKWAKRYGGWGFDDVNAVEADNNGDVYLTGLFTQTVSFNPPATNATLTSNGDRDIYFMKLDTSGNFFFVKQIGGSGLDDVFDVNADASGNVFLAGQFRDVVDFDPNAPVYTLTTVVTADPFIAKYTPLGNFVWVKKVLNGACGNDPQFSVELDYQGNVYGCGHNYCGFADFGNNFTVSNYALYIGKWLQDSCGAFVVSLDSLSNITCTSTGFASVTVSGDPPYTYSWSPLSTATSNTISFTSPGMKILTVNDSYCTQQISFMVSGPIYTLSTHDLDANLISSNFVPGFTRPVVVDGYNKSCIPVNGQLMVILDTLLNYQSASPVPSSVSVAGDTLIWNFVNFSFDSPHITPTISISTPVWAQIGDTVKVGLEILPLAGDAVVADNIKMYKKLVVGSYDPNDKQVYPLGDCAQRFVLNTEPLTYTIRFQNTGSAIAYSVSIRDTIDPDLNLQTLQVLSSSHSVVTKAVGNAVNFKFDNIMLPDSNSNEPSSHGYIVYRIYPVSSSFNGTIVKNTSAIYFDFNAPVLTNTTSNTIYNSVVNCITVPVRDNNHKDQFEIYPNPTSGSISVHTSVDMKNSELSISDVNGKRVLSLKGIEMNAQDINLGDLKKGFYIIELRKNDGVVIRRKLILE